MSKETNNLTPTSYLTSPPFEFVVGANRRPFFVNASLVASQSKPLTSLVSGGGSSPHGGQMRESLERRAILDDVDEDTFARFVEFALTNSYTPAEPCEYISEDEEDWSDDDDMKEENEATQQYQQQQRHVDNMAFTEIPSTEEGSSRKRRKGRKNETTAGGSSKRTKSNSNYKFPPSPVSSARGAESDSEHHSRTRSDVSMMMLNTSVPPNLAQGGPPVMYGRFTPTGPVFTTQPVYSGMHKPPPPPYHAKPMAHNQQFSFPSLPFAAAPPPREIPTPKQNEIDDDCTPVFLSHAKLYVFAEKYDVSALRALCLHNLHTSLSAYRIYSDAEGGHGAREVVNLINYTYENTMEDEGEELRKLVSWFCAWRAKRLLGCKFYCGCLEVGGMGVGFVGDLMGKLVSMTPGSD